MAIWSVAFPVGALGNHLELSHLPAAASGAQPVLGMTQMKVIYATDRILSAADRETAAAQVAATAGDWARTR